MNPEHATPTPSERTPSDPYSLSLEGQKMILSTLPDEQSRLDWVERHAVTFRKLFDSDETFRGLANDGKVADLIERIAAAEKEALH